MVNLIGKLQILSQHKPTNNNRTIIVFNIFQIFIKISNLKILPLPHLHTHGKKLQNLT